MEAGAMTLMGVYVLAFAFGACFGSFANVVIYRWPRELSLISPGSSCPHCQKKIKFYENIPIISWLFLKGRCSGCKERISIEYPLVELLTGLLFLAIFYKSGFTWTTLELCVFTAAAVPCFFIDYKHMFLPDIYTLSGIVIGILGSLINPELRTPFASLLGAILGGGFFYMTAVFYKKLRGIDGMGGGDIKLMAWLGALLGAQSLVFILMVSSVAGTLVGSYILFTQKKSSHNIAIPFGPFLIFSAYAYYFLMS
ncbi:MAG: prepilin peptidase [Bdellovibrionaceae bacterium]|nr:prepilin peptidase [Pseudobdellovibrionaceae bacterium]